METKKLMDAINATPTEKNYTQIPNETIRDSSLSLKATGLLCLFLSNKNGWKTHISTIEQQKTDKKHSINTALNELEKEGYLLRFFYIDKDKKVIGSFFAYTNRKYDFDLSKHHKFLNVHNISMRPSTKRSRAMFDKVFKEKNPNTKDPYPENRNTGNQLLKRLNNKNTNNKKTKEKKVTKKENEKIYFWKEFKANLPDKYITHKELKKNIFEFIDFRSKHKSKLTEEAIKRICNKFKEHTPKECKEAIDASIMSGWAGVFPKKKLNGYYKPSKNKTGNRLKEETLNKIESRTQTREEFEKEFLNES